jgi:homopolymeric O-antigen transport system permease protein
MAPANRCTVPDVPMAEDALPSAARLRLPSAARLRYLRELVLHLTRRELTLSYQDTLLGWTWPLARQLFQLGVLVFVFSKVLDLNIKDYPAFVFCGLIVFTWLSNGTLAASRSILGNRHFGLRPGFPTAVLPIIAVSVAMFDALVALPVLVLMLIVSHNLSASVLLLPVAFLVQFVLMAGLAWLCASLSVILRDIPNLVGLLVLLGFYITPVYFDVARVPDQYQWVLRLNPAAILIEADRAILLGTPWPPAGSVVGVTIASVVVAVGGYACFRRLSLSFADEL